MKLFSIYSANATIGCDLMHKGIGKCTQIVSYHPCGVFYSRTDVSKTCNKLII